MQGREGWHILGGGGGRGVLKPDVSFLFAGRWACNWGRLIGVGSGLEAYVYGMLLLYKYLPKWRWILLGISRDAKRRGIYLTLFTDPEGDSCFSIYQISWIKLKKVIFCKLKTSLSRNFVYNLQTFRGFCQVHFYDFVANSAWK